MYQSSKNLRLGTVAPRTSRITNLTHNPKKSVNRDSKIHIIIHTTHVAHIIVVHCVHIIHVIIVHGPFMVAHYSLSLYIAYRIF